MVYYCINCNEIHDETKPAGTIFKTGFHTINGMKIPVGLCETDKKSDGK